MNGLIVNLPVCRLVVYMVGTRNNHIGPVKIHPSTNYRDLPDTPSRVRRLASLSGPQSGYVSYIRSTYDPPPSRVKRVSWML